MKSVKRICFVTNEYMPISAGGIGMLVEQAVSKLSRDDSSVRVTVILLGPEPFADAVKTFGANHYPEVEFVSLADMLRYLEGQSILPQWAFTFENYFFSYLVAEYLLKRDESDGFDVIEFPDYKGFGYVTFKQKRLTGAFENTHLVVRVHGATCIWNPIDGVDFHSRERLQLYQMERYSLAHADSWTLPGKKFASQYKELLQFDYPQLNIVTPVFKKLGEAGAYWHAEANRPSNVCRIMFYGKQQHVKGLDYFIDAAVRICELSEHENRVFEFLVVGQDTESRWGTRGSYGSHLEKRIPEKYRNQIRFLGRIDVDSLPELVSSCSCAVIPSRMETFCLAAHELNWVGIPLILNRIPIFEDYFEDETSCLFFDENAEDLTDKILSLVDDKSLRERLRLHNNAVAIAKKGEDSNQNVYQHLSCDPLPLAEGNPDKHPLVSIIVPYYNDMRHYVRETLQSIETQDYPSYEVIVVNDGSTQDLANETFELVKEEYQKYEHFHFYSKPNGGLGSARNFAIEKSKGAFILPLDSDDLIEGSFLTDCVAALGHCPDLVGVSTYTSFFQDGGDPRNQIDYVIPYDLDPLLIFLENRAGVATSMFRRELFDEFSYDESLPAFEDWDFWMKLAKNGKQVEVLPKLLFRYRRRTQSMVSSDGFSQKAQLMHHIADHHRKHLETIGVDLFRAYNQLLWESQQVDENSFPHCRIYVAPNAVYDEKKVIIRRYVPTQLVEFEVRLPEVTELADLRFDPSAVPSSTHLNWMSLHHVGDPDAIWVACKENDYATIQVAGTARKIEHPDCLLIAADGHDPQIICPKLEPSEKAYLLRVSFRVFDRFEALLFEETGKDYRHY